MTGESFQPSYERDPSEDPRTQLADMLREFALLAVTQQHAIDSLALGQRPAGSLFKLDGGFLKVHVQVPAEDRIFNVPEAAKARAESLDVPEVLPPLWILIPVPRDYKENDLELEDIVIDAEELTVHVEITEDDDEPEMQFISRDDYIGQLTPVFETPQDIMQFEPLDELDQQMEAMVWVEKLPRYDVRTIKSTAVNRPDVA